MKTLTIKKSILAALLVSTTLVVSGCNHAAPAPATKTEAQLKHSFGVNHIHAAVASAAQDNGWQIEKGQSSDTLVLKKNFTKKETAPNTRGRIWNKVNVTQEILANVKVSDKSYTIDLAPESKTFFSNYNANQELNREMHNLKNAISVELVQEIL